MEERKNKPKINVLLNINNFTGEHTGRMAPAMIFMAVALAPLLLWMLVSFILPFKYFLIPWLLWVGRWALYILGNEPKRLKIYRSSKNNVYESAYDLVHIKPQYEDGLIEYVSGKVAYVISACPRDYLSDVEFAHDLSEFLRQFDGYEFDAHLHNLVDEIRLEDDFESLNVYTDDTIIHERMEVLTGQDEYCRGNTSAYRFNIVVKGSKYNWKKLKEAVDTIVSSDYAKMFNEIYVCNKDQVSDVCSRDILTWLNLQKMLTNKYRNEQYHDSKVLYYDEEIPDKYKPVKDVSALNERRVSE